MKYNQGLLRIDRGALLANFALLKERAGPHATMACAVKANAYGLGITEVSTLFYQAGARAFFVATLAEGIGLRALLPSPAIYVLGGFNEGSGPLYKEQSLIPVLNSFHDIEVLKTSAPGLPAALHFDTGMNRLGLGADETGILLTAPDKLKGLTLALIMSHFARADEKDHALTHQQYESFKKIAAHFPGIPKSLSNSSGIFRNGHYAFDMVRPGMALYGLNPTPEKTNPMRAVVSLEAPVLQVRETRKGESVGYGGAHVLKKNAVLATVGIGYADGFPRALSSRGKLYWQGRACPILGRVSMDLTVVDISDVPAKARPAPGDMMEVLGPHQDADTLAADAGTIGYEILTSLGSRYKRLYVD